MIRIGEFSRISRTPVSTLRYYDDVGLLKPVEVDHFTGYRYYVFEQLARLQRIQALKFLKFSIKEITRFLAEDLTTREIHTVLWQKRGELRDQIQDNHDQLDRLDAWIKQVEKENNMTTYSIRSPRVEIDLSDIVRITNPYESHPITTEQVREWFQYNPPGRIQKRLVSTDESGAVTGYGGYVHEAGASAGTFIVWVIVDPDHRGQGVGSALWDALWQDLKNEQPMRLVSDILDSDPQSLAFAQQRGFSIDEHHFHYALDLTTFNETPFQPDVIRLQDQGIRFTSLAEFPDNSETRHNLYELNTSYTNDNPNTGVPWTFPSFEEFVIQAPWFRREGQLLALDGAEWVGMAAVSIFPDSRTAYNLHTGVLPAYRGRKIATSLKVLAAQYARSLGANQLLTDSNMRNAPILSINRKMGYKAQPGKYTLVWIPKT